MKSELSDKILKYFSWCCTIILLCSLSVIIGFLILKGYKSINLHLIFADTPPMDAILLRKQVFDGLFPAIAGTLSLITVSILLAVPAGLATGIFLAEYCPLKIKWLFNLLFDILAGIPSIVVGLFGLSITILLHHYFSAKLFPCLLISALCLAFLVLPYIIRTTQISLEAVLFSVRVTAPVLGATKLQNIFFVLLPASLSGIISGIILSIGRCAEDTAVIMLTGAVATAGVPKSIFSNFEALPFYIYYISSQYTDDKELMTGFGACLILLFICTGLFVFAHFIKRKLSNRILYNGHDADPDSLR